MLLEAIPRNISASKISRYTVHVARALVSLDYRLGHILGQDLLYPILSFIVMLRFFYLRSMTKESPN